MIRDTKKLPGDVLTKIQEVIAKIADDKDVIALYAFGSMVEGNLKPLSDLDFGVLLSDSLGKKDRFKKSIYLIGVFNQTLKTDEIDLVILNDDPLMFKYQILKTGKLLYCRDENRLIDFIEKTTKGYLDFKPAREQFDLEFLKGFGFYG
jgi:predicted nucleotidyltransferase